MRAHSGFVYVITLLALLAVDPLAQAATTTQDNNVTCYLKIVQVGESPMHGNLRDFTEKLLQLRLARLKVFTASLSKPPDCIDISQQEPRVQTARPLFYVLQASIESRRSEEGKLELVLDYELVKYSNCVAKSLVHHAEPFAEDTALTDLTGMSNTVGLLLEDEVTAKKAVVYVNRVDPSSERARPIADTLTYELTAGLNKTNNFQSRDTPTLDPKPPDFTLDGKLTLSENALTVQFFVQPKTSNTRYPSRIVSTKVPPIDADLRKFFQDSTDTAISFLSEVQFSVGVGTGGSVSATQLAEILVKAKVYMCADAPNDGSCKPKYELALPLLLILSERASNDVLVFRMLGKAQSLSGNFVESAKAYDRAIELSKGSTDLTLKRRLWLAAGTAWYEAKNFETAAAHFEEGLKLGESAFDLSFSLGLARSYRFLGQRAKALEGLVDLLATHDISYRSYVVPELIDLLTGLQREDSVNIQKVNTAISIIQESTPAGTKLPANDVVNEVYAKLTPEWLNATEKAYAGSDFKAMDNALRRLESFPVTKWPILPGTEQLIERNKLTAKILMLRGFWHRDSRHDLDQAIKYFNDALNIPYNQIGDNWKYEIAFTYVRRAQDNPGPGNRKTDLEHATKILTDLQSSGNANLAEKAKTLLAQVKTIG